MKELEPLPGRLVKSKAGRDRGRSFIITQRLDDQHVLIVDGDLRKLANPKKKKLRHLILEDTVFAELATLIATPKHLNDAQVRTALAQYSLRQELFDQEEE